MSQPHSKKYKEQIIIYNINQDLRQKARVLNQKHYIPVISCKRNHEKKRFVSNDQCVDCIKLHKENYRNSDKGKAKEAAYGVKAAKINRAKNRASVYGLTPEQINEMKIKQNFKCAICENSFETEKLTHVDHCHKTNKVRALLCHRCNLGLGYFKDDIKLMQNAISYIQKHNWL